MNVELRVARRMRSNGAVAFRLSPPNSCDFHRRRRSPRSPITLLPFRPILVTPIGIISVGICLILDKNISSIG
jgi:hypothetical protein